jgi:hypothetical protein
MLQIIHTIPEQCPDCTSADLRGTVSCPDCGAVMVLQRKEIEEEDLEDIDNKIYEIPSNLVSCPHCHSTEFYTEEGEEGCLTCGLDPNVLDYPAPKLAHLWKEGSEIRVNLEGSIPKNPTTKLYAFLVAYCGPHCSLAKDCPQSRGNLFRCYKEEILDKEDDEMGKVKNIFNSKKYKSFKARKNERKAAPKEKERAVLKCSDSGWYITRYHDKLMDKKESTHTESGSGAEGVSQSTPDDS